MNKILLSHPLYKTGMKMLEGKGEICIQKDHSVEGLKEEVREADAYILRIGRIDRTVIENAERLRVITRPGVGVDNVDVEAATEYGIPVVICPASNARAVAEHTLTLLLAVSKDLKRSDMEYHQGNFQIRNAYHAVDIIGKTVSILGAGKIGMEVASMCRALGMKVILYDPYITRSAIEEKGYYAAEDLYEALEAGDYVTLHMPSNAETKGIIGSGELNRMKETAFFINCARGDLVEEQALFEILKEKKIAGAALDVLEQEPPEENNPLFELDNVIITPHMAAQTQETTERVVKMAVEGTLVVLEGKEWPYVCNPEVYKGKRWSDSTD